MGWKFTIDEQLNKLKSGIGEKPHIVLINIGLFE
jgi:hypothetical protein